MNGKPEKAVHIVDRKAEKVKRVNRIVNRKFKRRTQPSEWDFIPEGFIDFVKASGRVFYIFAVLIMGVLEGIRAGFIAGMQKALAMYR